MSCEESFQGGNTVMRMVHAAEILCDIFLTRGNLRPSFGRLQCGYENGTSSSEQILIKTKEIII